MTLDPDEQPELESEIDLNTRPALGTPAEAQSMPFNEWSELHLSAPVTHARDIPSLPHTFLFFALAILILLIGELLTVSIGQKLPAFRHESFITLASDARLMIPAQAVQYAVVLAATVLIFGAIWQEPFWQGIHWNFPAVSKRWIYLIGLGLLLGLASSLASNVLPMPKEAPILNDMMRTRTGAWLMFIFGTTGAPLIEEMAFRGFLLPSLVNIFRGVERSGRISPHTTRTIGMPIAILLTSAPFALLHSLQVSYAWAPVFLIGLVSIALCIVRLWTKSLAASTLVHATYNFSLFAGMLIASDGFRHLEKLNN